LLALLQQSKSSDNASNQISIIPSNTTTHTGNKIFYSFSSWILDSDVTDHICLSLTHFTSYHQINPISVKLPNGNQVITNYSGNVFIDQDHVLDNVLYIPDFTFNLLSVTKLIDNLCCVIIFYSNGCHIKDKNSLKVIGSVEMQDRFYILRVPSYQNLQIKPVKSPHITVNFIASDLETLWHFQLGHVSNKSIDAIKNKFSFVKYNKSFICDICHFANQKRLCFPLSASKSKNYFDLIHVSVWGLYLLSSIHCHKYFLTIIDDYSRYIWVSPLKQKSEVGKILENFVVFIHTQFEAAIKVIKSDNGTKFFMTNFFISKEIIHQTSCVNTPQQNSIVERKYGHLLNVARALMIQSHLSKNLLVILCDIHVVHIINMLPTPVLNDFSPHEMLYKTPPNFNQLKVFGSLCYASTLSTNRSKFDPRASKCVFIGFKKGTKGYILLNVQSREIFMYRDVVFYEHVFPYQRVEDTSNETDSPNIHDQNIFTEDQPILNQPSQVIFTPCDKIENNVNNDHESYIQIPEEVCSHRDQNPNENHETTQSI